MITSAHGQHFTKIAIIHLNITEVKGTLIDPNEII